MSFEINLDELSPIFDLSIDDLEQKYQKSNTISNSECRSETTSSFQYTEIEINESIASIYYTQNDINLLIAIYGPKETRIRDKVLNDQANIEVNTKFNKELTKEKNSEFNSQIIKFLHSMILTTSYPKCSIHFCINILSSTSSNNFFSSNNINYISLSVIYNGLMLALCLSGIDLKALALTKGFIDSNKRSVLVSLDANVYKDKANVLFIESNIPMQIEDYYQFIESTQKTIETLYQHMKLLLYKKLKFN